MLQSEKKLKARHREKNYFKRHRSTQDLIPVDTVYPDGMFLSNGNIYSKSYRFSDINYQIAGQAEKEGIIRDMRALAKGCTPGELSQITIVNRHINRELLERLQYQSAGDGMDELRGEMNEILESQAGRGTGIIQERYFTTSVSKSTPREAAIHFDRVGTELALGFANMGSKLTPIGLSDRLRILHDFYRPGDENYWQFDFEDKQRKKHSFKDSIAPMSFLPAPDYFKIGSRYVRVLAMTEYASWIHDDTVMELINLDTEMILSVSFLLIPTEESVKYYTKKLDSLEANSMRFQQKQLQRTQVASPEPYNFRKDRDSITDSLNDIIQKDLGMVVATVTLAHMADSLERLDSDTELIRNVTRGKNCDFNICTEQQLDAVNTVLPYGLDRIYMDRSLTTETLAAFVPFSAQEICDPTGVLYGQNAVTRNGVTGRTFERPGFQKMLEDIEQGKINCVVVKDLSRLGRNAIDSGFYLEKYFPLHHVRFIAVNDQYDSEDSSNSAAHMIVPLKNMVNEAYAADISRKVRSQQRQAMQEGQFVGSRPPYGYLKDPKDCHKLVVNPDTAPVVRQIFEWAADGVSKNQIVLNLNESGTLTPGRYLASIGLITNEKLMGSGVWQTRTLDMILKDEVYIGDMVQGKTRAVGHKQVISDKSEWVVVHNTHEPIISRELFENAQKARKLMAQKYTYAAKKSYSANILKGKIFCGCCGTALHRHRSSHGDGYCYYCLTNYRAKKGACATKAYITEDRLFEIVMGIVRQKAEVMLGKLLWTKQLDSKVSAKKSEVDGEIVELRLKAQKNKAFLNGLYENLVNGILTETEYRELREGYIKEVNYSLECIQQLTAQQSELEQQAKRYICMADMLTKVDTNTELTAQLVDILIERITVNGPDDISIDFRFECGFNELLQVLGDE